MRQLKRRTELADLYETYLNDKFVCKDVDWGSMAIHFGTMMRTIDIIKFNKQLTDHLIVGCDELTFDQLTDKEAFAYNAQPNDIFYAIKQELIREFEEELEMEAQ